jgi:hypothetical protein
LYDVAKAAKHHSLFAKKYQVFPVLFHYFFVRVTKNPQNSKFWSG